MPLLVVMVDQGEPRLDLRHDVALRPVALQAAAGEHRVPLQAVAESARPVVPDAVLQEVELLQGAVRAQAVSQRLGAVVSDAVPAEEQLGEARVGRQGRAEVLGARVPHTVGAEREHAERLVVSEAPRYGHHPVAPELVPPQVQLDQRAGRRLEEAAEGPAARDPNAIGLRNDLLEAGAGLEGGGEARGAAVGDAVLGEVERA
mmetsp:Transcript_19196/g.64309  ORF Transcript_19196/g.64309 Transcript_19196/m.64309 type:complete len:203 (-) Transcript_19196:670-1278(-)